VYHLLTQWSLLSSGLFLVKHKTLTLTWSTNCNDRVLSQVSQQTGRFSFLLPTLCCASESYYQHYAVLVRVLAMAMWLPVCVCHKLVFYQNGWTNRARFWHGSFLPTILHCVKRKFMYLQKYGYFPVELCPKLWIWKHINQQNVSSAELDKVWHSDHHQLTIPPSFDAQPL